MTDRISQLPAGTLGYTTLSAKVKALTDFLMHGAVLPESLKQHGSLLIAFTAGAATASAIFSYFNWHRNDRAKINLAVFHITRIIENTPEYQARLERPHELIRAMDVEVKRLLQVHLNHQEADGVMLTLKRKLWVDVDENRALVAKRRKHDATQRTDSMDTEDLEMQEASAEDSQPSPVIAPVPVVLRSSTSGKDKLLLSAKIQAQEDSIMADVDALVATLTTPVRKEKKAVRAPSSATKTPLAEVSPTIPEPLSNVSESGKASPSGTFLSYSPVFEQAGSSSPGLPARSPTQRAASSSPGLPFRPPTRRAASSSPGLPARPPTRRGRYDSSPPSTSNKSPPSSGKSTHKNAFSSSPEGGTTASSSGHHPAVQAARGYGLNYSDEELYSSSPSASAEASSTGQPISVDQSPETLSTLLQTLAGARNPVPSDHFPSDPPATEKTKTSRPPSTVKFQQPPNSRAIRTGDKTQGHWLHAIQEGTSPHESPAPGTMHYHVAGSKGFYKTIEGDRKVRRNMREFFGQGDETMRVEEPEAEVLPAENGREWADPSLTHSSTEEMSLVRNVSLSPIGTISDPPSAPEISAPLPSLPEEPQTPRQSSPLFPSDLSPLSSDMNVSSPRQESAPPVASPPTKRSRPKKVAVQEEQVSVEEGKPDTPMPAKGLGRSSKAASKLQMPATPKRSGRSQQAAAERQTPAQTETPSGRTLRRRAFKGSYKA